MNDEHVDALRRDISERRAIVIVGAGASVAATNGCRTATWVGLIRSGADLARAENPKLPDRWLDTVTADIDMGVIDGYVEGLVSAAEKVTGALGGQESRGFKNWLERDVGSLRPTSPALLEAIVGLGIPIATTNYDSLLEETSTFRTVTWREPESIQRAFYEGGGSIVHLHGHWEDPKSIVFGHKSYERLVGDSPAQSLQHAVLSLRAVIFVGVGDGISDPNFSALRAWLRETYPKSEIPQYRLCLTSEFDELLEEHHDEAIRPIAYGASHGDLAEFLRSVTPRSTGVASRVSDSTVTPINVARARTIDSLTETVRAETILAEHMVGIETLEISELLIPPVLLPVSSEQYMASLDLDLEKRPKRCDPSGDAGEHSRMIVASGDNSGLTSTLRWLIHEAGRSRPGCVEVVVDFRKLKAGNGPLEHAIRRQLMQCGALADRNHPIPPCVVAIDNVNARPVKIFDRAMAELATLPVEFAVLGCREGVETALVDAPTGDETDWLVRYIGRLSRKDIAGLVALAEPARADQIATTIINAAKQEHLARTPFTVGLLASVILHGESLESAASQTALVDAYVNLMLGRGDPHEDARFSLDAFERSDILSTIARAFVERQAGELPEGDMIAILASYFEAVAWEEDPMEVLDNFIKRRVLAVKNGKVRFAQNTFLHLFAAKEARQSREFRDHLYSQTLYYAPVIRHYAGLTRNDEEVIIRVEALLPPDDTLTDVDGSPFNGPKGVDDASAPRSLDDVVAQLQLFDTRVANADSEKEPAADDKNSGEWLDVVDGDDELAPFPVNDIADAPASVQLLAVLALVSNVLRDSELVKDSELKARVLGRTLTMWGRFTELLSADPLFGEYIDGLTNALLDESTTTSDEFSDVLAAIRQEAPVIVAYAGISATLSSRKLLRSLDATLRSEEFGTEPRVVVMGALLAYDIQSNGWSRYFEDAYDKHRDTRVVRKLMGRIALSAYRYQQLSDEDEPRLRGLVAQQMVDDMYVSSEIGRKQAKAEVSERLRQNRLNAKRHRLPAGENVLSEPIGPNAETVGPEDADEVLELGSGDSVGDDEASAV